MNPESMPNTERAKSNTSAGFSVLDMLIVVVIVSIIVTYILGQISTIQETARTHQRRNAIDNLRPNRPQ
jgi:type II secretory pathway pseudopilin PulG